jgi:hypothetical protein
VGEQANNAESTRPEFREERPPAYRDEEREHNDGARAQENRRAYQDQPEDDEREEQEEKPKPKKVPIKKAVKVSVNKPAAPAVAPPVVHRDSVSVPILCISQLFLAFCSDDIHSSPSR